jgi:hypothetical protein
VVHAAPVLMANYVEAHHDLPSANFADAIMAM